MRTEEFLDERRRACRHPSRYGICEREKSESDENALEMKRERESSNSRRYLRVVVRGIEIDVGLDLLRRGSLVVRDRWCSVFGVRRRGKKEVSERSGSTDRRWLDHSRPLRSSSNSVPLRSSRRSVGSPLHQDDFVRGCIPGMEEAERIDACQLTLLLLPLLERKDRGKDSPVLRPRGAGLLSLPFSVRSLLLRFGSLVEVRIDGSRLV